MQRKLLLVGLCITAWCLFANAARVYADAAFISQHKTAKEIKSTLNKLGAGAQQLGQLVHIYRNSDAVTVSQREAFRKVAALVQNQLLPFEYEVGQDEDYAGFANDFGVLASAENVNGAYAIVKDSNRAVLLTPSDGPWDTTSMVAKALTAVIDQLKANAKASASAKSGNGSGKANGSNGSNANKAGDADDLDDLTFAEAPGKVVELTESTFDKEVMKSAEGWFVSFTAPWCPHCRNLKPDFADAASQLKSKIWFANVDCTTNQALCSRFNVRGYPTIKFFRGGRKQPRSQGIDYNQARTAQALVNFALDEYNRYSPKPGVPELKTEKQWSTCLEGRMCVVALLPKDAKKRKEYLATLKSTKTDLERLPFRIKWVWTEPGKYPDLDASLGVNSSTSVPNIAVVNPKRGGRVLLLTENGAEPVEFTQGKIREHIDLVMGGSATTRPMSIKPQDIKIKAGSGSRSEL